jgi:hypothetical protein
MDFSRFTKPEFLASCLFSLILALAKILIEHAFRSRQAPERPKFAKHSEKTFMVRWTSRDKD